MKDLRTAFDGCKRKLPATYRWRSFRRTFRQVHRPLVVYDYGNDFKLCATQTAEMHRRGLNCTSTTTTNETETIITKTAHRNFGTALKHSEAQSVQFIRSKNPSPGSLQHCNLHTAVLQPLCTAAWPGACYDHPTRSSRIERELCAPKMRQYRSNPSAQLLDMVGHGMLDCFVSVDGTTNSTAIGLPFPRAQLIFPPSGKVCHLVFFSLGFVSAMLKLNPQKPFRGLLFERNDLFSMEKRALQVPKLEGGCV